MRALVLGLWLATSVGCKAELSGGPPANDPDVDAPPFDPGADAPAVDIDAAIPLGPWSTPMAIPGANDAALGEDDPVLSPSGLELIFARVEADGTKNLYRMRRGSPTEAWSLPSLVENVNRDGVTDQTPRMNGNGKTLYFASPRGAVGGDDIYMATRQTTNDPFGNPTLVPAVNDTSVDRWLTPCGNGYVMISRRNGDDDDDLFEGSFGAAPSLVAISSEAVERGIAVTPDCLTMYFASNQEGTFQLYSTTRNAVTDPWPEELPFTDLAIAGAEQEDPFLSEDGRTFVLTVTVNGNKDLYISTR